MLTQSKSRGRRTAASRRRTGRRQQRAPAFSSLSRPAASIAPLMSVSTTSPVAPTRSAKSRARSPVPPARSSTRMPARTPVASTAKRFHSRCRPADMRSFMRSYLLATESNTPRTRRALSSARPPRSRNASCRVIGHLASRLAPGGRQPVEIALPQLVLPLAEVVEVVPRIDAGVVAVGERRTDRVVADGFDLRDRDVALADLQHLLARAVAAHFRRRRIARAGTRRAGGTCGRRRTRSRARATPGAA